jgi:hypothetical protein
MHISFWDLLVDTRTGYQLEHSRSCPASKVESGIYLPTLEP